MVASVRWSRQRDGRASFYTRQRWFASSQRITAVNTADAMVAHMPDGRERVMVANCVHGLDQSLHVSYAVSIVPASEMVAMRSVYFSCQRDCSQARAMVVTARWSHSRVMGLRDGHARAMVRASAMVDASVHAYRAIAMFARDGREQRDCRTRTMVSPTRCSQASAMVRVHAMHFCASAIVAIVQKSMFATGAMVAQATMEACQSDVSIDAQRDCSHPAPMTRWSRAMVAPQSNVCASAMVRASAM